VNSTDSSKLDPLIFTLFFYPLRGFAGCAIGLLRRNAYGGVERRFVGATIGRPTGWRAK